MARNNPKLGEIQRLILYHTASISEWAREKEEGGARISTRVLRDRIFWINDRHRCNASLRASFSRSLRQLESRGLIVSWNDIHDKPGYTTHISLTERGQKLAESLQAKQSENVNNSERVENVNVLSNNHGGDKKNGS